MNRRTWLAGCGAAWIVPQSALAADPSSEIACPVLGSETTVAACRTASGDYAAIVYDPASGKRILTPLPARGHDVAVRPRSSAEPRECVILARRPGTFALVFTPEGTGDRSRAPFVFEAPEGRHFYGHGVFSEDGRLLFTTEADIAAGTGVIGVYDATGGYARQGEFPSGGIGPHDLALMPDGRTLAIANGGIDTGGTRTALNLASMAPSLAYVDSLTGELRERVMLSSALHRLSIRHLAMAARDTVVFGCQFEGPQDQYPPLVGFHRRGESPTLLELPESVTPSLRNYVGSVAADDSGTFVIATSSRGGTAVVIDTAQKCLIDTISLTDVSGVAARHQAQGFLLTAGTGAVRSWGLDEGPRDCAPLLDIAWDNHLVAIA